MVNEISLQNLRTNVFSSDNQPEKAGRTKGVRNRRTIFKEWLSVKTESTLPDGSGALISLQDQIVLKMIDKARNGDVNAAILVMDSAFGKIANVNINEKEKPKFDMSKLSESELLQIEEAGKLFKKCIDAEDVDYEDVKE